MHLSTLVTRQAYRVVIYVDAMLLKVNLIRVMAIKTPKFTSNAWLCISLCLCVLTNERGSSRKNIKNCPFFYNLADLNTSKHDKCMFNKYDQFQYFTLSINLQFCFTRTMS